MYVVKKLEKPTKNTTIASLSCVGFLSKKCRLIKNSGITRINRGKIGCNYKIREFLMRTEALGERI